MICWSNMVNNSIVCSLANNHNKDRWRLNGGRVDQQGGPKRPQKKYVWPQKERQIQRERVRVCV
jgi:hypothetical protein